MPELALIDCGSRKLPELAALLERAGARVRTIPLARGDEALAADGVVISGGPHLFTADPALIEAFAFVDRLRAPALGICLGHQAIALRHGASVFLGAERRQPEPITISGSHPLVSGLAKTSVFVEDHCEGVTLPEGFACLGSSEHYAVEIMACDRRRRYGVQFHPEVSGEVGAQLLARFVELVGG